MEYIKNYLSEAKQIIDLLPLNDIHAVLDAVVKVRDRGGRLFFIGCGGGAGHASHAVNDFRKIAGIECYAPTDNVSELTARINDDGWETVFARWLATSRLSERDGIFILSVGGGSQEPYISPNIVSAVQYAKSVGSTILGIVGRDGGVTAKMADACVVVPPLSANTVTAHTEAFQAVIWHLIVSHPRLQRTPMKWESLKLSP